MQFAQVRQRVGDVVPAGMVEVLVEKLANSGGVHVADLHGRAVHGFVRLPAESLGRVAVIDLAQNVRSRRAAHLDDKLVVVVLDDLRQREIEAVAHPRSGLHRCAKTGGSRLRAIHGDHKYVPAPALVDRIRKPVFDQHPVLHLDGGQFTGAHSEEGVAGRRGGVVEDPEGRRRRAALRTAAFRAGEGTSSNSAGRRHSRTAPGHRVS